MLFVRLINAVIGLNQSGQKAHSEFGGIIGHQGRADFESSARRRVRYFAGDQRAHERAKVDTCNSSGTLLGEKRVGRSVCDLLSALLKVSLIGLPLP